MPLRTVYASYIMFWGTAEKGWRRNLGHHCYWILLEYNMWNSFQQIDINFQMVAWPGESICISEVYNMSNIEEVHYYMLEEPIWLLWLVHELTWSDGCAYLAISSDIAYRCVHTMPIYWIIGMGFHANHTLVGWVQTV